MSRILYRAKSERGVDVADFVEASSAAEAMEILTGRGLKDIVLMQSPDLAAFNTVLPGITPQQHARLRAEFMDRPGLATALRGLVRVNAIVLAAGAALLLAGAWLHQPAVAVIGALLLLFPFAVFFWKRRHLDRYRALQKAYALGQWDEVRRIAPLLRSATHNPLLPWDVDVRLACIQARQGRLDEAVASVEAWKPQIAAKAPGMYEARVASVYYAAGDYDTYLKLMEQAAELARQDPSRMVDVALAHAKFGDPRHAEAVLASIDTKLLTPIANKFLAFVNGLVQLRTGQPDRAVPELRTASDGFLQMSLQSPVAWVGLAVASGYLAVALARGGKREEAQALIAPVLPVLLVHGEKPLMDMLQGEVLQQAK